MLQKIRVLLLVCITAVLAACGGGGEDETPSFAGNYLATLGRTVDNCNTGLPAASSVSQSVSQSGRVINITSGSTALAGSVDSDNGGFSTSITQVSNGINVVSTISYRTITTNSKYAVAISITAGTCVVSYSGTAAKI